jgi:hypothetical protein
MLFVTRKQKKKRSMPHDSSFPAPISRSNRAMAGTAATVRHE